MNRITKFERAREEKSLSTSTVLVGFHDVSKIESVRLDLGHEIRVELLINLPFSCEKEEGSSLRPRHDCPRVLASSIDFSKFNNPVVSRRSRKRRELNLKLGRFVEIRNRRSTSDLADAEVSKSRAGSIDDTNRTLIENGILRSRAAITDDFVELRNASDLIPKSRVSRKVHSRHSRKRQWLRLPQHHTHTHQHQHTLHTHHDNCKMISRTVALPEEPCTPSSRVQVRLCIMNVGVLGWCVLLGLVASTQDSHNRQIRRLETQIHCEQLRTEAQRMARQDCESTLALLFKDLGLSHPNLDCLSKEDASCKDRDPCHVFKQSLSRMGLRDYLADDEEFKSFEDHRSLHNDSSLSLPQQGYFESLLTIVASFFEYVFLTGSSLGSLLASFLVCAWDLAVLFLILYFCFSAKKSASDEASGVGTIQQLTVRQASTTRSDLKKALRKIKSLKTKSKHCQGELYKECSSLRIQVEELTAKNEKLQQDLDIRNEEIYANKLDFLQLKVNVAKKMGLLQARTDQLTRQISSSTSSSDQVPNLERQIRILTLENTELRHEVDSLSVQLGIEKMVENLMDEEETDRAVFGGSIPDRKFSLPQRIETDREERKCFFASVPVGVDVSVEVEVNEFLERLISTYARIVLAVGHDPESVKEIDSLEELFRLLADYSKSESNELRLKTPYLSKIIDEYHAVAQELRKESNINPAVMANSDRIFKAWKHRFNPDTVPDNSSLFANDILEGI